MFKAHYLSYKLLTIVRTRPLPSYIYIAAVLPSRFSQLPRTEKGLRDYSCPPRRVDWETGESLQLCYSIDLALHLRELLISPVPSSRPSVEHDTLLQVLQSSYSCSPPKPLAGHLQHCQTEERFITRPTACMDSAACVHLQPPPAVGCKELCTGHWAHSRSTDDPGDRLVV